MNNTTVATSTSDKLMVSTTSPHGGKTPGPLSDSPVRIALVAIYAVVLMVGIPGVVLMINVLKSNLRSVTTVAVLNLIVAHLIFLPTVLFRIDYFFRDSWDLGQGMCKVVSAMIFIHMYLSFIIYVVLLIIRFHSFYKQTRTEDFYRRLHSVMFSAAVWAVVVLAGSLLVAFTYGNDKDMGELHATNNICFNFGSTIRKPWVKAINYVISTTFVIVPCVLGGIQAHILLSIAQQYGAMTCSQQEFWAQMKSLCFVVVMLVCFVPYHIFRMHYLSHSDEKDTNELFLAITALSCADLLTFVRKGACRSCGT